jgi:cytoskeletal protein CcmA (bactofilin family)
MLIKDRKDNFESYSHSPEERAQETVISSDAIFKGSIKFKGILRVDGKFSGDMHSQGTLLVGKTGEVKATVKAESVVIEGKVNGNIHADNKVELKANAKLFGDIKASRLMIEEGVSFVGNCDVNPANESADVSIDIESGSEARPRSNEKKRLLDSIKEKESTPEKGEEQPES